MQVDESGNIWFRQSWLDTANRCGERGRLSLVYPEQQSNDLASMGTCVHAAIERILTKQLEPADAPEWLYEHTLTYAAAEPIKWVAWTLPSQMADHAVRCVRAFNAHLLPHVEPGGKCEAEFRVPLTEWNGHTVGITGTVDYVTPSGLLIDWKTSSRKFDQRIKQRTAIQPTVYSVAATHGAFGDPLEWPVTFRYGVMIRGREVATTQFVDVQRSHAHEAWLLGMLRTYCNLAGALGLQAEWPRDDDHYLCNETWCPWWSMCKGANLSADQDNWSH